MNAHCPQPIATAVATFGDRDACQVAKLGRLFTVLQDLDRDLGESDPATVDAARAIEEERRGLNLLDRADAISAEVEWIEATSLEGVYFQLLHLGSLFREIASGQGDSIERGRLRRSFERLQHLAMTGLERIGGFDGADYGRSHKTLIMSEFDDVRAISVGCSNA